LVVLAELDPARAGTARITVTALGLVLGLSSAGVLPLLLPWQGAALLASVSVGLSLLPFVGLAIAWRRAATGLLWSALAVGAVSGLVLLPLWHVYRGQVRVLNLGEEPFGLWVDGRRVARVEPSSGESALAGVELTIPSGVHEFRVRSELDGRELFRARQLVAAGSPHLFVPVVAGYCFSIEHRSYGDSSTEPVRSEPLEGEMPFWVLPDGISWFTPNPEPGPLETSGGTLSCLRQKRCTP
jgi:hypothetical protein